MSFSGVQKALDLSAIVRLAAKSKSGAAAAAASTEGPMGLVVRVLSHVAAPGGLQGRRQGV